MGPEGTPGSGEGREHYLRAGWRWFNRWRKRYWKTRVLILLIIFGPQLYEILTGRYEIVQLVRIACKAIKQPYEMSHPWYLARYYRAEEVQRLQTLLKLELDANRDGAIGGPEAERAREAGLDPAQLRQPVLEADLTQLIAAARLLQLVPESYTEQQVRQRAWDVAAAESQRFFEPYDRKIESLLDARFRLPDYAEWSTWRRGLDYFMATVFWVFGSPSEALTWVLVCLLMPLAASLAVPRGRRLVGLIVGCALAPVPVAVVGAVRWSEGEVWVYCLGFALLTGTVGYMGGKAAARVKRRLLAASRATLVSGVVLLAYGVWQCAYLLRVWRELGRNSPHPASAFRILRAHAPMWAIVAGTVLAAVGGVGLWMAMRHERARAGPT
jgi:hypothetical protein